MTPRQPRLNKLFTSMKVPPTQPSVTLQGGTETVQTVQAETTTVAAAIDTTGLQTASSQKPVARSVPSFSLGVVSCCGACEVSGIESAYHSSYDFSDDDIFVGFERSFRTNYRTQQELAAAVSRTERQYCSDHTEASRALFVEANRAMQGFRQKVKIPGFMFITFRENYPVLPRLSEYIKKHNLGAVVITPPTNNPNSGNNVIAVVWCVDQKAYYKRVNELMKDEK